MRSKRSGVSAAVGSRPQEVTQMLDATFTVALVGDVPVVTAPEEIDITNAGALRSALLHAAAGRHRTLVVDMTHTQFCDSSGLHTLIAAHRRAEAEGREMLLVIPGTAVLRVFAITAMDRVIPNFSSLDEALAQASVAPADLDSPTE
jgi:anti-sigma B factor antagonist